MENFTDYYRVLRVSCTADDAAIKAAFRRRVRRCHPDVARDKRAVQRFLRAREAYEILSDPERRRAYDEVYRARRVALRPRPRALEPREIARRMRGGSRFVVTVDLLGLRIDVATDTGRRGK
jgi:curved DNA-binding protein CbpA